MGEWIDIQDLFEPGTDDEYRKLAFLFPEYIFLDDKYQILLAGQHVEELLQYKLGSLRAKSIQAISLQPDLKSSLMIEVLENFFEWRAFAFKTANNEKAEVEVCGIRLSTDKQGRTAIRIRRKKTHRA